ncbi:MAG: hypothetical protein AAF950_18175 [Pseudomonadota bacterium]
MENPSKVPLTLIEMQTGSYFGDGDIMRYAGFTQWSGGEGRGTKWLDASLCN